jgi:hypothetical protein
MLYCFSLQHVEGIAETKAAVDRPDGLSGRDWQIWQAVLVLAQYLDGYGVVGPRIYHLNSGEDVSLDTLYGRMVTMALEKREYKLALDEEHSPELRMIQAIFTYLCENPAREDWYPSAALCKAVSDELGWEKPITAERLSRLLVDQTSIAKRSEAFHEKRWQAGIGKRTWHWRLDPATIRAQAEKLFGRDLADSAADGDDLPLIGAENEPGH